MIRQYLKLQQKIVTFVEIIHQHDHMKGIIKIIVVLGLAFFTAGCAKEDEPEIYYYGNGEKVYLNERKDMLFVHFWPDTPEGQKQAIVQCDASLTPWTYHNPVESYSVTFDGSGKVDCAVLQSRKPISQAKLLAFRNRDEVRYVSYVFENRGSFFAISDQFSAKLNNGVEESRFADLVHRYGCTYTPWMIAGVPWEDMYIITVPKNSGYGTIVLSCIFFDSDLVEWTSPDFHQFGLF